MMRAPEPIGGMPVLIARHLERPWTLIEDPERPGLDAEGFPLHPVLLAQSMRAVAEFQAWLGEPPEETQ